MPTERFKLADGVVSDVKTGAIVRRCRKADAVDGVEPAAVFTQYVNTGAPRVVAVYKVKGGFCWQFERVKPLVQPVRDD